MSGYFDYIAPLEDFFAHFEQTLLEHIATYDQQKGMFRRLANNRSEVMESLYQQYQQLSDLGRWKVIDEKTLHDKSQRTLGWQERLDADMQADKAMLEHAEQYEELFLKKIKIVIRILELILDKQGDRKQTSLTAITCDKILATLEVRLGDSRNQKTPDLRNILLGFEQLQHSGRLSAKSISKIVKNPYYAKDLSDAFNILLPGDYYEKQFRTLECNLELTTFLSKYGDTYTGLVIGSPLILGTLERCCPRERWLEFRRISTRIGENKALAYERYLDGCVRMKEHAVSLSKGLVMLQCSGLLKKNGTIQLVTKDSLQKQSARDVVQLLMSYPPYAETIAEALCIIKHTLGDKNFLYNDEFDELLRWLSEKVSYRRITSEKVEPTKTALKDFANELVKQRVIKPCVTPWSSAISLASSFRAQVRKTPPPNEPHTVGCGFRLW